MAKPARALLPITGIALMLSACTTPPPTTLEQVGEVRPGTGLAKGYLARNELPDSLALVPPPPAEHSAALEDDREAYRALKALRAGPRGAQARKDAELKFPAAANHFACALGIEISERDTPHLVMLLRRSLVDTGLATYKAKDHYKRTRPFVAFKESSCTPEEEAKLSKDGSYPSGHSALGWGWALILTQLAPERTDALVQRGRSYGQSRAVCGVHWKSDIEAGRTVAAATVARLQVNETFRAQMAEAKREIARARDAGRVPPPASCAAESSALATSMQLAP